MPYVKRGQYQEIDFIHFNNVLPSGGNAPYNGIYKCVNCGYEVSATTDTLLPSLVEDARHQGWECIGVPTKWQLVALATQKRQD